MLDPLGPTSFRKDYRTLPPGGRLIRYGLSDALNENGRNLRAAVTSLLRIPTSTMPWWHAGRLLNQNRGVFGLNLLSWWKREGGMERITTPLLTDLAEGRLEPSSRGPSRSSRPATRTASSLNVGTSARWCSHPPEAPGAPAASRQGWRRRSSELPALPVSR